MSPKPTRALATHIKPTPGDTPDQQIQLERARYAPRLRERLRLERQLADDAEDRGWDREVDRHQRIADRIRSFSANSANPATHRTHSDIAR